MVLALKKKVNKSTSLFLSDYDFKYFNWNQAPFNAQLLNYFSELWSLGLGLVCFSLFLKPIDLDLIES